MEPRAAFQVSQRARQRNLRLQSSAVEMSNGTGRQVLHSPPIVAMRVSVIQISEDIANKRFVSVFPPIGSFIRVWILGVFLALAGGVSRTPAHLL